MKVFKACILFFIVWYLTSCTSPPPNPLIGLSKGIWIPEVPNPREPLLKQKKIATFDLDSTKTKLVPAPPTSDSVLIPYPIFMIEDTTNVIGVAFDNIDFHTHSISFEKEKKWRVRIFDWELIAPVNQQLRLVFPNKEGELDTVVYQHRSSLSTMPRDKANNLTAILNKEVWKQTIVNKGIRYIGFDSTKQPILNTDDNYKSYYIRATFALDSISKEYIQQHDGKRYTEELVRIQFNYRFGLLLAYMHMSDKLYLVSTLERNLIIFEDLYEPNKLIRWQATTSLSPLVQSYFDYFDYIYKGTFHKRETIEDFNNSPVKPRIFD